MRKLGNKGMTITEVVVSVALVSMVLIMVFRVLVDIRYEDALTKNRANNLVSQALLIKSVQDDINDQRLQAVVSCGPLCINFTFVSGLTTKLEVLNDLKTVTYTKAGKVDSQSFVGTLTVGPKFTYVMVPPSGNDFFLLIKIPISDDKGYNYDVEIFYTYNVSFPLTTTLTHGTELTP